MNEATATASTKPEGRAAALLAHYERAGYVRSEPALLQPAEPFLDLSGEDIRRRMYLTTDAAGHERPFGGRGCGGAGPGLAAPGRAVPRPLGRGHPPPHVSDDRRRRPRAVPAPGSHHPGLARLSRLACRRQARGLLLSRAGVPLSPERAGRVRT